MSYCSNCGTKHLEEDSAYCHFCGASLKNRQGGSVPPYDTAQVQEPDIPPFSPQPDFTGDRSGSVADYSVIPAAAGTALQEEPFSVEEEFKQTEKKSGLRPGHIVALVAGGLLVLAVGAFLFLCFLPSAKSYKAGTEKLEAGEWQEAKTWMEDAEKKGIFLFQNSMDIYKQKVDEYGKKQLTQLESLLQTGEYNRLEEILQSIPEDSAHKKDAQALINETNSKLEAELEQIDLLIEDRQLDEALNKVQLFMEAYPYDKYTAEAESKLELINKEIEIKRQEEMEAEKAAQEAYERELAAAREQEADKHAIEMMISGYVNAWAQAVTYKDFRIVEPYIAPMSSFYEEQQRVHQSLSDKKINEELLDYQVIEIEAQAALGTYKVYVYEKYAVYAQDGSRKDSENNWVYTVQSDPQWGISKIERDNAHQGRSE